ncbi:MAG: hypothetical protein P8M14_06075 [Flavobacteriaceae bacterium]|nr:hypothetical protein [Flavobacteriaceae bacterium]
MSTAKNKKEEEVDLGSLFTVIGNGFRNFFNFIASIFKGIFHKLILILIFFKLHFVKFTIAVLLGGIVGFFLEKNKEIKFSSNLIVKPNFESTQLLYENINYYNDLVKQQNTKHLASIFKIDSSRAASLRKFEITPLTNSNDIINAYDKFILDVDTLTVKSYDFQNFEASFTDYDYLVHNIEVKATVSDIFKELENTIINSIEKNTFFTKIKNLTKENLNTKDSILKANFIEVDSLRNVYMRAIIEGAKNNSNGTNIDLGGKSNATKENDLFEIDRKIIYDLSQTYQDIATKSDVINIISNFKSVGSEIKGITKNLIFIMAALAFLLTLFFILLLDLNKYLENYKK